jgi:hypothetical protein
VLNIVCNGWQGVQRSTFNVQRPKFTVMRIWKMPRTAKYCQVQVSYEMLRRSTSERNMSVRSFRELLLPKIKMTTVVVVVIVSCNLYTTTFGIACAGLRQ